MAAPKKGILAIMAGGDPEGEDEEGGDEPLDAKSRALQDMFAKADAGDWKGAAAAFKDAYDICATDHGDEPAPGEGDGGTEY
jgi:hypothetical protein